MKSRFFLLTFGLMLALSACAPAVGPLGPPASATPGEPTATPQPPTPTAVPSEAPTPTLQPVATSRGPDLEASNPTAVRLDSGGLQLVEFFRFT